MSVHLVAWGKFGNGLARLAESVLSLVYPPRCVICLKCEQSASCRFLCEVCFSRVLAAETPPIRSWQHSEEIDTGFHACACDLAAWFYEDSMMALVPRMKYQNRPTLAEVLADLAAERLRRAVNTLLFSPQEDSIVEAVLVPVPLHPRRQRERGYNQSLLIARVLSQKWNMELEPFALRRTRYTPPQAKLNAAERAQNVRGVFSAARAAKVAGKIVFLVDDVITTGATVSACARELLQAGAVRVIPVALTRTGRELRIQS